MGQTGSPEHSLDILGRETALQEPGNGILDSLSGDDMGNTITLALSTYCQSPNTSWGFPWEEESDPALTA